MTRQCHLFHFVSTFILYSNIFETDIRFIQCKQFYQFYVCSVHVWGMWDECSYILFTVLSFYLKKHTCSLLCLGFRIISLLHLVTILKFCGFHPKKCWEISLKKVDTFDRKVWYGNFKLYLLNCLNKQMSVLFSLTRKS